MVKGESRLLTNGPLTTMVTWRLHVIHVYTHPHPPHTHSHYKSMSVTKITKRGSSFLGKALAFKKKNTLPYTYTEHIYFHICRIDFLCTVGHFMWLMQLSKGNTDIVLVLGMDPRISYIPGKLLTYTSLGF